MKSKKALLALLLAAAMSLSLLVGCADTPPNNGTPAPTPDGAQGEAQPDTPDAALSAPEEPTEDIASSLVISSRLASSSVRYASSLRSQYSS